MSTSNTEYIQPLARRHRSLFFYVLVLVFVLAVPVFVFYASGYRYTMGPDEPRVQMTGAMYIWTLDDENSIELNGRPVRSTRFFRRATYIQGLLQGMHDIVVYGEDMQTWVKRLPVYPQMVTEFSTFTLPQVPQVRPITPLLDQDGDVIFLDYDNATSTPFAFASSSVSFVVSTSTAPLPYSANPEYDEVAIRFKEALRVRSVPIQQADEEPAFRFAEVTRADKVPETDQATGTLATSTVQQGNLRLEQRDDEVFAVYTGPIRTIPHYFCVPEADFATTAKHYGDHVAEAVHQATTTAATTTVRQRGTWHAQICRTEIRIDRMRKTVSYFNFVPGANDLVLLHLEDGLYVTEIDDRAWQNHQLLFPDNDIFVLVENGQIFIQLGDYFAEVFITRQNR